MRFLSLITSLSLLCNSVAFSAVQLEWNTTQARVELKPGEKEARTIFTATNKGETPIRISEVKTSCGCTGSILNNRLIQPGETGEVIGIFQKGKRSGLNRNKLDVYVEGTTAPVVTLEMIVDIPTLIEATPRIVYWNPKASRTPRTVQFSYDEDYVNRFGDVEYDESLMDVRRIEDPVKANVMSLEITPKSYDSTLRTMLVVKAKGKNDIEAEARVHVFVQP